MLPDIFRKLEWLDREELIKKFVSVEFNRFLDYYKNAIDLNSPQEFKKTGKSKGETSNFTRFFINLGRTDDLRPNSLMGLINEFTGINDIEIGKIELLKNFSFFEVDSDFADKVFNAFKDKSYKKRKIVLENATSKGKTKKPEKRERFNERRKSKDDLFDKNQKRKSHKTENREYNRGKKKNFERSKKGWKR